MNRFQSRFPDAERLAKGFGSQRVRWGLIMVLAVSLLVWAIPAAAQNDAETQKAIQALIAGSKARAAIVKEVSKAVVHISVEKTVKNNGPRENGPQSRKPDLFDDEFFRKFFAPRLPVPPREFKQRGLGSGTIVDKRGYILTNNHVIADADKIVVKLKDGTELKAKLIGADPATDIAVLKIEGKNLPLATLGNSDQLEVGETVIAIGNPFGLEQTVTQGIVSAKGRSQVGLTDYEDFIQTDASINPGNSGGPLINLYGRIVGVNTAIFSRSGGNMGIGFSIPINQARVVMAALIDSGKVTRGFLGVVIQDVTPELAEAMGVDVKEGVLIANVGEDTPAGKSGIRQSDIILRFNGRTVKNTNALRNVVAATKPGEKVPVELIRDGKPERIMVEVGEQPKDMRAAIRGHGNGQGQDPADDHPEAVLGLEVQPLSPDLANRLGYTGASGVLISNVKPDSPAAQAGLRRGALIEKVNRRSIKNVQEFRTQISKVASGKSILMLVRFERSNQFHVVKKP